METALAIYEALIQANVPAPAARRVAETLERDMSSNLATKQDLQHFNQLMTTRHDALESRMVTRFESMQAQMDARFAAVDDRFNEFESRVGLMLQNLESRLLIKLGALITVLIGAAATLQALLR